MLRGLQLHAEKSCDIDMRGDVASHVGTTLKKGVVMSSYWGTQHHRHTLSTPSTIDGIHAVIQS